MPSRKEAEFAYCEQLLLINKAAKILHKEQNRYRNISEEKFFLSMNPEQQTEFLLKQANMLNQMVIAVEEQVFWTKRINDHTNKTEQQAIKDAE